MKAQRPLQTPRQKLTTTQREETSRILAEICLTRIAFAECERQATLALDDERQVWLDLEMFLVEREHLLSQLLTYSLDLRDFQLAITKAQGKD